MGIHNHSDLDQVSNKTEDWLLNKALPLWADKSPSPEGGFYERHDLKGEGIPHEDSRVRLQARQTYCFALAAGMGWEPIRAKRLVKRGLDTLIQNCRRSDGLYGTRVQPGQGLTNNKAETYDCAFALLAFATSWHHLKTDAAFEAGKELSSTIDILLKRPDNEGGYAEHLPKPVRREQNPHMHLCEASLAWYEATGDEASLNRALNIIEFVEKTFWDDERHILREFDLSSTDNHIQIGHMFEWAWILRRMSQISGRPLPPFAYKLYASAVRLLSKAHYLPLSSHFDGRVREDKQRTWTLAEALKAHIAMADHPPTQEQSEILAKTIRLIFKDHLDGAIDGAWIDIRSSDGRSLVQDITPATGYHIFTAFADLVSFNQSLSQSSLKPER